MAVQVGVVVMVDVQSGCGAPMEEKEVVGDQIHYNNLVGVEEEMVCL